MTPTPTLILLVAAFWTLPASLAVLAYRESGSSVANMKAALSRAVDDAVSVFTTDEASAPLDA